MHPSVGVRELSPTVTGAPSDLFLYSVRRQLAATPIYAFDVASNGLIGFEDRGITFGFPQLTTARAVSERDRHVPESGSISRPAGLPQVTPTRGLASITASPSGSRPGIAVCCAALSVAGYDNTTILSPLTSWCSMCCETASRLAMRDDFRSTLKSSLLRAATRGH